MIALDARIKVEDPAIHPPVPCAIRPYPTQWEKTYKLADGSEVLVRPIRPEDERFYALSMARMDPEDIRLRMFMPVREFSHEFLARMTQIDYAREMAFIALRRTEPETWNRLASPVFSPIRIMKRANTPSCSVPI